MGIRERKFASVVRGNYDTLGYHISNRANLMPGVMRKTI